MIAIMPPLGTKKNLPERTTHVHFAHQQTLRIGFAPAQKERSPWPKQTSVSWTGTFMDRSKAPNAVLLQIACAFGNASIIGRGNSEGTGFATIETSGQEAELFALVPHVIDFEFDS